MELNKRQRYLLTLIQKQGKGTTRELLPWIREMFGRTSRITVIRDLNALVEAGEITRYGEGRSAGYRVSGSPLMREFDEQAYFAIPPDRRAIQSSPIEFKHPSEWEKIFTHKENESIEALTERYRKNLASAKATEIQKELERITVEFSWKSSRIEGNTYSLLDTERLIKQHEEAKGHSHEEAVMILNHKKALDYLWTHYKSFTKITPRVIEEIHALVIEGLGVKKGLRTHAVGIIGTAYRPLDNVFQLKEALSGLCDLVNRMKEPFAKATVVMVGLAYLQPFGDGNKRTSRLAGNALLMAHGLCPLSYRSIDEVEYKKAVILFDEQHSLMMFKKLIMEQYAFAIENYFR